jgi:3-oxoadipate enol-lactonase
MSELTVTTNDGLELLTRVDGVAGAPWLLLLNSLGTDLAMWDGQLEAWATTHRVLRFDQRGHGRSTASAPPYTIERFGSDVLAVLDAHEVESTDVCGISLGGLVALWLAGTSPARVRRAVFADTGPRIGTEEAWRDRAEVVRTEGMRAVTDLVLERFFSRGFRSSGHPAVGRIERSLRDASIDGYSGSCEALATADLTALARTVTVPSLVVVGTADEATPPEDARALHSLLPGSQLVELDGAGHLANIEQPGRFADIVQDFLAGTEQEADDA